MKITAITAERQELAAQFLLQKLGEFSRGADGFNILIVPDRHTQTFERRLLEVSKSRGSFNTEVFSFRRLMFRLLPSSPGSYLQKHCGVMAVKKLLADNEHLLGAYRRASGLSSFAESLFELINSLSAAAVTPDILGSLKLSGRLGKGIGDIALIYRAYREFLQSGWTDHSLMLEQFPSHADSDFFKGAKVFVAGFDQLTELERRALSALVKAGTELTVCCQLPAAELPASGAVLAATERICTETGAELVRIELSENPGNFKLAAANYFLRGELKAAASEGNLNVYRASTPADEVRFAAAEIRRLTQQEGMRFRDIFIAIADPAAYAPLIAREFAEYETPVFLNPKHPLAEHPAAMLVLDACALTAKNLDRINVLRLVKNPYFPADSGECDCFENYCLKHGIDRTLFLREFELTDAVSEAAERVRLRLCGLISMLGLPRSAPAEVYAEKLKSFFDAYGLEDMLAASADEQRAQARNEQAAFTAQAYRLISGIADDIQRIFGDQELDAEGFYSLLDGGFASLSVSLSPVECDSVQAGDFKSPLFSGGSTLFVLGCNLGFPPPHTAYGLLSDSDMRELSAAGVNLSLDLESADERARLSAAMLAVSDFERFYYCGASSEGFNFPSALREYFSLFDGLEEQWQGKIRQRLLHAHGTGSAAVLAFAGSHTYSTALLSLMQSIALSRAGETQNILLLDACYAALKASPLAGKLPALLGDIAMPDYPADYRGTFFPSGTTSVSVAECFFTCPFKHFAQYGLRARERELFEIRPLDTGNFLHRVAEIFVSEYLSCRSAEEAAIEIFERVAAERQFARQFEREAFTAHKRRLLEECRRFCAALKDGLDNSEFKPLYTEAVFGRGGQFPAIDIPGLDFKVTGKIDREGVWNSKDASFVRVIDYKSGKSSSLYSENKLKEGTALQLFVYLRALTGDGGYKPAGAYYFPVLDIFTDPDDSGSPYSLSGVTARLPELLGASDSRLLSGDGAPSVRIPVSTAGGTPAMASSKNAVDAHTLELYMDYAVDRIKFASKEILAGCRDVAPVQGSCTYCEYLPICENYSESSRPRDKRRLAQAIEETLGGNDNA